MLGPGVDPRSRTRAATPISGGWREMARTKNSVCEKSPVRNHVVPATVARMTTRMIAAGTAARTGYLRSTSAIRVLTEARRRSSEQRDQLPSAVRLPSALRTGTDPSVQMSHH